MVGYFNRSLVTLGDKFQPIPVIRTSDDEKWIQDVSFVVIQERPAVQFEYRATCLFDHSLRGRGIPFRRQTQSRVDVGTALGDDTKLQRTAHWQHFDITYSFEISIQAGATM